MTTRRTRDLAPFFRGSLPLREADALTDGQLLECFVTGRGSAAAEELVRRHAAMVWGVCCRVLGNHHDAEDAFQATFFVLLRKAASVAPREMVANWLHGVALQTARKARATAARRGKRELQMPALPEPVATEPGHWHDWLPVLDHELSRLPDRYRFVILLCDLEGKTRREAAGQLGCPEGTIAGRLARARVLLAKRLARRGVAVSGGALATALAEQSAPASVPTALAASACATSTIPLSVAAMTEGVLRTMFVTKCKFAAAVLLFAAVVSAGAGGLYHYGRADETPKTAAQPPRGQQDKPADPARDLLEAAKQRQEVEKQRREQFLKKADDEADRALAGLLSQFMLDAGGDHELMDEALSRFQQRAQRLKSAPRVQPDRLPIWELGFEFYNLRLIAVNLPAGKKQIWYLKYRVSNKTDESHTFLPDFEFVVGEKVSHDQVIPRALDAVRQIEDPADVLQLKNSVTIAMDPIPPMKFVAGNKGTNGVAVWDDADPAAQTCTLYVGGLTNAWETDGKTVQRKVLKISLKRVNNELFPSGTTEWVYRSSQVAPAEPAMNPTAEIDLLIRRLDQRIGDLEASRVAWKEQRQLQQERVREWRNMAEQAAKNLSREDRDEFLKQTLAQIKKAEDEIAAGDRAESAAHAAIESHKKRLDELRRSLHQAGDLPADDAQRSADIEKLKRAIGAMGQRRKNGQAERAQLQSMIDGWKKLLADQPGESPADRQAVLETLERQLKACDKADSDRQIELRLLDRRLRALTGAGRD